jgi:hypothetical protein
MRLLSDFTADNSAWIELHRDELQADWELAVDGENPYKITPL